MPGFVIHLAVAKEYLRHKDDQEDENEFYRGVIAPDLLKKPESHYGSSTSDPDIERYIFQIQIPKEIQEIVKFEEGEPVVLSVTEMYNFIRGFAGDLKELTDGSALIRNKIS